MAGITDEFKKILGNLEKEINDKDLLDKVKTEMFNLYNAFLDTTTKMNDLANTRMAELAEGQSKIYEKLEKVESGINSIEKDIYDDVEEDYDLTLTCPYCNKEIVFEPEELKNEIICPECNNVIELDWGHGCSDDGCESCGHHCNHDEDDDM